MQAQLEVLFQQFRSQSLLDWAITISALAYVFLAAKERPVCWLFGIVSSGLWAWADFAKYNLWVDGLLQVFYVFMGFAGLYAWLFATQKTGEKAAIQRLPLRQHGYLIILGLALTALLGELSSTYNIPEKNIITHSMVWVTGIKNKNKTSFCRWRKEDPWGFDHTKVGMKTDPFAQLDKDVMSGKVASNIVYIKRDRQRRNTSISKEGKNKIIDKMTYGLRVSEKKSKKR